jgi:hypothetical protein
MTYATLTESLRSESFFAYQLLLFLACYLFITSGLLGKRGRSQGSQASPFWLKLAAAIVILSSATLTLRYRIIPQDTIILPWECESVYFYYMALHLKQSFTEYALSSVERNPGVLSASAHSLMYGVPTYSLLPILGWNTLTLRIVAYAFSLIALIPGYYVMKRLFNPSVALLFLMVLAANPHTIFYAGYGVSQTATLFGFLLALALALKAIQEPRGRCYAFSVLAGLAFFAATFNYSPAKVFVVITLGVLSLYGISRLTRWSTHGRSGLAALLVVSTALGSLLIQRTINPGAEFTTARGEQAFELMRHKEQIINYLGDTPDVQAIQPWTMPITMKAKFLLAVAARRWPEFVNSFSPFNGVRVVYPRGVYDALSISPYPIGLTIPLLLGCIAALFSLKQIRGLLPICLVGAGICALLLTTRFDGHRSYLLLVPITGWIAHGLWIALQRLDTTRIGRLHNSVFVLALSGALVAHSWFFMGIRDYQRSDFMAFAAAAEKLALPNTSIALSLGCNIQAPVELKLAEAKRTQSPSNLNLWNPGLGTHLNDFQFKSDSEIYQTFLQDASRGKAILLYDSPITKLLSDLESKQMKVENSWDGTLGTLVVSPVPAS